MVRGARVHGYPTAKTVDGFRAIQDGRTIYVGAVNVNAAGAFEPLIYTIAYSEGGGRRNGSGLRSDGDELPVLGGEEAPFLVTNAQVRGRGGGNVMRTATVDTIRVHQMSNALAIRN